MGDDSAGAKEVRERKMLEKMIAQADEVGVSLDEVYMAWRRRSAMSIDRPSTRPR